MPGNGVGNIGTRFPRLKRLLRYANHRRPSRRAPRNTRWKLLLAPLLALLLFALLAELGGKGLSHPSKRAFIAALADPFSLLSARSPGLRGAGTLLSIKGPHERVRSMARDRWPPAPIPEAVASIPIIPPAYDTTFAENQLGGFPPLTVAASQSGNFAPQGLAAPRVLAPRPLETTAIPEPASWTMVGGSLAVGVLVRQYVRKRRAAGLT